MGIGAGMPIPYCMGCCVWHCRFGAICGHMVGWAAMGAVCWATVGALCAIGGTTMGGLENAMGAMERCHVGSHAAPSLSFSLLVAMVALPLGVWHLLRPTYPGAQTWFITCHGCQVVLCRCSGITRRRMARERRGAGSSVVSIEALYNKTIY